MTNDGYQTTIAEPRLWSGLEFAFHLLQLPRHWSYDIRRLSYRTAARGLPPSTFALPRIASHSNARCFHSRQRKRARYAHGASLPLLAPHFGNAADAVNPSWLQRVKPSVPPADSAISVPLRKQPPCRP